MSGWAIRVDELTKLYRRMAPGFPRRTLKSALLGRSLTAGLSPEETIPALESLSFVVERGEAFGVIGHNGSGKSTLLKVLAGILPPTSGSVEVAGSVAALIELGAGFHPEISGRENIFINGALLGLTKREIHERYERIVEFSGLGDFIEEPVKNYSSGMYVRLGFSVAIHTEPDVLLVDEVLAVGDEAFAHRCLRRIEEILSEERTVLMVSHSLSLIEEMCGRVLWLDGGRLRLLGSPRRVADAYRQAVAEAESEKHRTDKEERERKLVERGAGPREQLTGEAHESSSREPAETLVEDRRDAEGGAPAEASEGEAAEPPGDVDEEEEPSRWGSRVAEIAGVRMRGGEGDERYHFRSGEAVAFEIEVRAREPLGDFVFGIAVSTPRGIECWGTNTHIEGFVARRLEGRGTVTVRCPGLRLAPGEYLIDVAVHSKNGAPYDYHRRLLGFSVTAPNGGVGVYFPEHEWSFAGGVQWLEEPGERPAADEEGDHGR